MAQIVPGTNWAEQLGTGLGSGLNALAQNKINQLQQRHFANQTSQGLQALGFNQQEAQQLAHLDPQILNQVVKQKLQEPNQMAYAQAIQQLLGGEEQQFPLSETENVSVAQQPTMQQQVPQMPGLANLFPQLQQQNQTQGQQANVSQARPLSPSQAEQIQKRQASGLKVPLKLNEKQATTLAKLGLQQQALGKKEQAEAKKLAHQEDVEAAKETKKYYDNILSLDEAAEASEKRLDKMENLINKKGGLPTSTFYKLFKNLEENVPSAHGAAAGGLVGGTVGGPLGAAIGAGIGGLISPVATILRSAQTFTSPNTEEFEKLSNDFVREAKSIFGSRITDQDLKTFMSLVPTLSQTDNGKLAIIKNMRNFLEANKIKSQAMKQIIRQNNGRRPFDLPLLVEERSKSKLDKLASDFVAD